MNGEDLVDLNDRQLNIYWKIKNKEHREIILSYL